MEPSIMDPIANPFSPGAGAPPPELVGRDDVLEQVRVLLGRLALGRPEKSLILTGLRGVGKTVLLNEVERRATADGHRTLIVEAREGQHIGELIAPNLRQLLYDLDRIKGAGNKARRALAVLRSFIGGIKVKVGELDLGLDIEPEKGSADSGDLHTDLTNLFVAVAEAAQERNKVIVLLIDEIQYIDEEAFSALIRAMHRIQQRLLPLALVAAGLPIVPGLAGDSKSYAERLFSFPSIGPLTREESHLALQEPTREVGVEFETEAANAVFEYTEGYPYFLQEWGYQAWNTAESSPITVETVRGATATVISRLDKNFFRVRFDRLTPAEKRTLRAMAELGAGPYRVGDIASKLGYKSTSSLSPVRMSLIKKGMIYSPAHGNVAFTVPLFDQFMKRAIPDFQ